MSHILFCSLSLLIFKTPILIGSIGRNRRAWSQRSTGMYYAPCPNRCVVNLPFNDVTGTSREPWPAWTTWTNWTACEPLNSLSLSPSLSLSLYLSIFLSYSVLTHRLYPGKRWNTWLTRTTRCRRHTWSERRCGHLWIRWTTS